jgi:hypothetical protein
MLIYKNDNINYIFIHIPKNSGTYIRKTIENNKDNIIVKSYWHVRLNFDLAHIPYVKKDEFIEKNIEYNYFTYVRDPYDRIISAYFYIYSRTRKNKISDFKNFVKNVLTKYNFSMIFDSNIIHFYPQHLFVCNENLDVQKNITIHKLPNPKKYNLIEYFDNKCIEIINNIYYKDFISFGYEMINSIE